MDQTQKTEINYRERLEALMTRRHERKLSNVRYRKLKTAKWNDYHIY